MKMFIYLISLFLTLNVLAQEKTNYLGQLKKSKLQLKRMVSEQYSFNEMPSILDSLSLLETFLMEVDGSNLDYSKELKKSISSVNSTEKQQMSVSTPALVSKVNLYLGKNLIIEGIVQTIGKASNDKIFILLSNNVKCIFPKSQQTEILKIKYGSQVSIKGEVSKSNSEVVINNAAFIVIKKTSGDKTKILDDFHRYIGNLIIVTDKIMKSTIENEYRKAVELFDNNKYSIALSNFEVVSNYGGEYHELNKISDSTSNYIPYMKALLLEEDGNYNNASIIFDSVYAFKESKIHMENCLTKYYDKQSQVIASQKNDIMLIKLFQDIHNNILRGKDKDFFVSSYKRIKYSFIPIVQSWIIGDPVNFIKIPSFNAKWYRDNIVVPQFYICPHELKYSELVCCCIVIDADSILSEWSAVQSFNGGMFGENGNINYYHIKNDGNFIYSVGRFLNNTKKIEKYLGLRFLDDGVLLCLDQRYPKNKYNRNYLRSSMGNNGSVIWDRD